MLRDLLRRLFRVRRGKKNVENGHVGEKEILVEKSVEERILESLIQEDQDILDTLRKAKVFEIYLNNWRSYYRLLQYQYAEFLEKRRRERGQIDFYVS